MKLTKENLSFGVSSFLWEIRLNHEVKGDYHFIDGTNIVLVVRSCYDYGSHDRESDRALKFFRQKESEEFREKGWRLVHVTHEEFLKNGYVLASMLHSMVGRSIRIPARKTKVGLVDAGMARWFFGRSHIQGYAPSDYTGLFIDGSLVAAMGTTKARFDRSCVHEITRFANLQGYTVVGGFSKLLKAFREENEGTIVSYADFSRSNGDVYSKNGFREVSLSPPSYRWWREDKGLLNRHSAMRRHLPKLLGTEFREEETEVANMWRNGYHRIWDCGQIKFIMDE